MAHAHKPHFVFRPNGRVHLNRPVGGVSSVDCCAAVVCASAVVMLDTPCSEVVWRVLANYSIHQFPLHFPYRASPCAITFQPDFIYYSFQMSVCCPGWFGTFHNYIEKNGQQNVKKFIPVVWIVPIFTTAFTLSAATLGPWSPCLLNLVNLV